MAVASQQLRPPRGACAAARPVPHIVPHTARRRPASGAACVGGSNDQAREVEYVDGPGDILFIALCRLAYGKLAGWQSPRSWTAGSETFKGMVEVSRALMKGRTAAQQRDAVVSGFPSVPPWFRRAFPYSGWGAEVNARITPAFFTWLVGPMTTEDAEVTAPGGEVVAQKSAVHIERCRYLAESRCAAMCNNLCKVPVQHFFTLELGMPLYMEPNFEDFSCKARSCPAPPPSPCIVAPEGLCWYCCGPGSTWIQERRCTCGADGVWSGATGAGGRSRAATPLPGRVLNGTRGPAVPSNCVTPCLSLTGIHETMPGRRQRGTAQRSGAPLSALLPLRPRPQLGGLLEMCAAGAGCAARTRSWPTPLARRRPRTPVKR